MFGILDLNWKPTADQDTPPVGRAPAIVRNDTWTHTIRVIDGAANGFDSWDWAAQVRAARLTGSTAGTPLASMEVSLEVDDDDLLVHLGLPSTVTTGLELPQGGVWDLQLTDGTTVTTWLQGKVKVLDDVTRVTS